MTSTTVSPAAGAGSMPVEIFGRVLPYKYIVAIVYVVALFLDILDVTIVNVAIPELGRTFATEKISSATATRHPRW